MGVRWRQMCGMSYDSDDAQGRTILVFGGASDTQGLVFLQDLYSLDVSSADVRPRPKITAVSPASAALSGAGTRVCALVRLRWHAGESK